MCCFSFQEEMDMEFAASLVSPPAAQGHGHGHGHGQGHVAPTAAAGQFN